MASIYASAVIRTAKSQSFVDYCPAVRLRNPTHLVVRFVSSVFMSAYRFYPSMRPSVCPWADAIPIGRFPRSATLPLTPNRQISAPAIQTEFDHSSPCSGDIRWRPSLGSANDHDLHGIHHQQPRQVAGFIHTLTILRSCSVLVMRELDRSNQKFFTVRSDTLAKCRSPFVSSISLRWLPCVWCVPALNTYRKAICPAGSAAGGG